MTAPTERPWVYTDASAAHLTHSVRFDVDDESRVPTRCGKRVKVSSCTLAVNSLRRVDCPTCLRGIESERLDEIGWKAES